MSVMKTDHQQHPSHVLQLVLNSVFTSKSQSLSCVHISEDDGFLSVHCFVVTVALSRTCDK